MRKTGNVILVAPQDELSFEKQQLESKVNVENLEPLKTQVFQLQCQERRTSCSKDLTS